MWGPTFTKLVSGFFSSVPYSSQIVPFVRGLAYNQDLQMLAAYSAGAAVSAPAAILGHELGHYGMARLFGCPAKLHVDHAEFPDVMRYNRLTPFQKFAVAAAGPVANLAMAGLVGGALVLTGRVTQVSDLFTVAQGPGLNMFAKGFFLIQFSAAVSSLFPFKVGSITSDGKAALGNFWLWLQRKRQGF